MKNNIIFLDIDGVVNTLQISKTPFKKGSVEKDGYYFQLCHEKDEEVSNKQAVLWLDKLCHETNAKIVISSTWRKYNNYNKTVAALYNSGLSDDIDIIGMTPIDCFSCPRLGYWQTRGTEISNWLLENKDRVLNYVILDDDCDMGDLISHLVRCDTYYGFGCKEYNIAIDILNAKKKE